MSKIDSESAIKILIEGNKRFIEQQSIHPHQSNSYRKELIKGQKPFAIILGCSDSRVPPEIIFDQGIGDLFVIRVAGNVIDETVIASVEYAVEHLGTSLLVVLGHSECGAVISTIRGDEVHGNMKSIVKAIEPAVKKARKMLGDIIVNSIRANIQIVIDQLKTSSSILSNSIKNNSFKIVGAFYNMDDGKVTFM